MSKDETTARALAEADNEIKRLRALLTKVARLLATGYASDAEKLAIGAALKEFLNG